MTLRPMVLTLTAGLAFPSAFVALAGEGSVTTRPAMGTLSFSLDQHATTSAGVYDSTGRLVRVLWSMKQLPAGQQTATWDGLDEMGNAPVHGDYSFRITINGGAYRNIGAIGNSGKPPSAFGHTPTNMESVAVDAQGALYTANGWDEAGADFKKWDANGNSMYDAQYSIRNGKPNGAPYSIAVDDKYMYCGMGGWENEPWKNRQQVQRFALGDGKAAPFTGKKGILDGHIQVYEWPGKQIPEGTPAADAALMKAPLRAVAIAGDTLLVADALGGKVRKYHKETGTTQGDFAVRLPHALAVDAKHQVWVGHEHHKISVFDLSGRLLRHPIDAGGEIEALACGPQGQLFVADSAAGAVRTLDPDAAQPKLMPVLGKKGRPGDRAADRFFHLRGVAVDRSGSIATIQRDPPGGARLARWSPDRKLLWEHFGTEFVSLGNYGQFAPDNFFSMSWKKYRLISRNQGTWAYVANINPEGERYRADPHGVVRVLHLGANDFVFLPMGDGVQAYRIDGNVAHLAALVGGREPAPEGRVQGPKQPALGQWTWADSDGNWAVDSSEVLWFREPGKGAYGCFGMDVDGKGNICFANQATHSIWMVPLVKLNSCGNPVYDWAQAKEIVAKDESALGFQPNMAQRAEDESVFTFGWSRPWPQPKNNPFWMGGSTLARFDSTGHLLWAVPLPKIVVGLDVVPGGAGGCMTGEGQAARIAHYSADGLLLGELRPGEAMSRESGWMDNHASVAINRDPRDGLLDVFAEDDYVQRIGWYRVDDTNVQVITGKIVK